MELYGVKVGRTRSHREGADESREKEDIERAYLFFIKQHNYMKIPVFGEKWGEKQGSHLCCIITLRSYMKVEP